MIHPNWRSRLFLPAFSSQNARPAINTPAKTAPERCQDSKAIASGVVGADGTGEIGRSKLVTTAPAMRTRSTQKATKMLYLCSQAPSSLVGRVISHRPLLALTRFRKSETNIRRRP